MLSIHAAASGCTRHADQQHIRQRHHEQRHKHRARQRTPRCTGSRSIVRHQCHTVHHERHVQTREHEYRRRTDNHILREIPCLHMRYQGPCIETEHHGQQQYQQYLYRRRCPRTPCMERHEYRKISIATPRATNDGTGKSWAADSA